MIRTLAPGQRREIAVVSALAIVALLIQFTVVPIDADVSWLITVGERVAAGQRLYVDIFEVNPPASVWIYLPQIALAKLAGLRPETVIVLLTTAAATAATLLTVRLSSTFETRNALAFTGLIAFVLLVLPGGLYAQREHYALILSLPIAAIIARLARGDRLGRVTLIVAGFAAGLVIVIKPHFLFAILVPAGYAGWSSGQWRPVLAAGASAVLALTLYCATIALFAPEYFAAIPMLAEVYGPMRERPLRLIGGASVTVPIALAALAWVLRPGYLSRLSIVILMMIAGFTIAVLVQGKGYWNHALPGIGLGLVAIGWSILSPAQPLQRLWIGSAALALLSAGLIYAMLTIQPPPGLVAALRQVAPPHPSIISLGTELSHGHPAVRLVDGRWAGTRAALFTAAGVRYRTANWTRAGSPELKHWYDEDLAIFAADVARNQPDVILTEEESMGWLSREPLVRTAMRDYRPVTRVGEIGIWLRRDKAATGR